MVGEPSLRHSDYLICETAIVPLHSPQRSQLRQSIVAFIEIEDDALGMQIGREVVRCPAGYD
jgi:hypothetical protein